jgi:hypothetical protein
MQSTSSQLDSPPQLTSETKIKRRPYVRSIVQGDIQCLSQNLRFDDYRELEASGYPSWQKGLEQCVVHSHFCRIIADKDTDEIYGIFGARLITSKQAAPWLLGSYEMEEFPLKVIKEARFFFNFLKSLGITNLWNTVYAENELHIKWLKLMGFTISSQVHHNAKTHEPFKPFKMNL